MPAFAENARTGITDLTAGSKWQRKSCPLVWPGVLSLVADMSQHGGE